MWHILLCSLVVLCCSLERGGVACERLTVISPKEGHDSPYCILGGTEKPCSTLGYVARASPRLNDSVVEMEGGDHSLNVTASFTAVCNLTLRGSASLNTTIQCVTNGSGAMSAGLTFQWMRSLSVSYLSVFNCSCPEKDHLAVLIGNSTNVEVSQVNVSFSIGVGLELIDVGGTVSMRHLMLNENRRLVDGEGSGGSGLLVTLGQSVSNASYVISFCDFTGNGENWKVRKYFTRKIEHHGRGAGMALYFMDNASNNSFDISSCSFDRNNALWGGGLSLVFSDNASCNTVYISDVLFCNNTASVSGGGGTIEFVTSRTDRSNRVNLSRGVFTANEAYVAAGLNIGCSYDADLKDTSFQAQDGGARRTRQDAVVIDSTTFTCNYASAYGGGTGVYASHLSEKLSHSLFQFNNCTWEKNTAFFSSAVDLSPIVWDATNEGYLPTPTFDHCHFLDNRHLSNHLGNKFHYTGAFVLNAFKAVFSGDTLFQGNTNTALLIVSGAVEVESNSKLSFIENVGNYGGAIQMTGFSFLYVNDDCSLLFINNKAQFKGGGMYVSSIDQRDFFSSSGCFIQHTRGSTEGKSSRVYHNTTVLFEGNVDQSRNASSIYTTSLYPCFYHCFNETDTIDASHSFDCIANFSFPCGSIETSVHHIELSNGTAGRVFPGVKFTLGSSMVDELNNTDPHQLLFVSLDNDSSMSVAPQYIAKETFELEVSTPEEVTTVKLHLKTDERLRQLSTAFNLNLSYCSPGFMHEDEKCACSDSAYVGIGCKGTPGAPVLKGGFWTGYINTSDLSLLLMEDERKPSHLYTTLCAFQYCLHKDLPLQSDSDTDLEELQCSNRSRQGIMCSRCKENYSVSFHSQDLRCREDHLCKFGMLFYVLSELLPLVATFLAVVLFNIRFTSGAINGFILTSQLMDAISIGFISSRWNSRVYGISPRSMNTLIVLETIYRFFNFEFLTSIDFCLWKGATSLDVLTFKYATICFGVFLILVFVLVTRYCNCYSLDRCFQKLNVQKSTIHGLVAFFVMCYGQCTKVTFQILTPVKLEGLQNKSNSSHLSLFSGEWYFHGHHRVSCLVSFLFFPVIFLPPVLLVVYPLHYKVLALSGVRSCTLCKKAFGVLDKLKPLLDAFQGCFKDGLRFFAGLYFLYRVAAYGTYMLTGSLIFSHIVLQCVLVLLLALHSLAQPYERRWHNALDSILLTDLILINSFVLVVLYNSSSTNSSPNSMNNVVHLMIVCKLLPLLYMGSYVTWKGVKLVRRSFCSRMGTEGLPELTHLQESDSISHTSQ